MMGRVTILIYGVITYAICLVTFLYAAGFLGNMFVPKSIDSGAQGPLSYALLINSALLGLFAIQHSLMARKGFKKIWTKIVPQSAERSTYVLFSSLAMILLFWQWRPMGGVIWDVPSSAGRLIMHSLYVFGWILLLVATFLINHFDLFGLRQVWLHFRGKKYTSLGFMTPGLYKHVRHPLYVGWLFTFWATPTMTAAHLVFAIATTAYILIAIQLEERDMIDLHGDAYSNYRKTVPMLIPVRRKKDVLQETFNEL